MLRAIFRKWVQGLATAIGAVAVSDLAVTVLCALEGAPSDFGINAALRVGLPAFVAGVLFFPVNEKTLARRAGFAVRAGFAAFGSALVHRSLLWAYGQTTFAEPAPDGWFATLKFELAEATTALLHPSLLVPQSLTETTLLLSVGAIAGAAVLGFVAQPALLQLARGLRATRPRLGPMDSSGARDSRRSVSV